FLTCAALALTAFGLTASTVPADVCAQYPVYQPQVVAYAAPAPAVSYYVGSSYSLYSPAYSTYYTPAPAVAPAYSYYPPAVVTYPTYYGQTYVGPRRIVTRFYNPGPYYYSFGYPYSASYYSYYYTPGFFRY